MGIVALSHGLNQAITLDIVLDLNRTGAVFQASFDDAGKRPRFHPVRTHLAALGYLGDFQGIWQCLVCFQQTRLLQYLVCHVAGLDCYRNGERFTANRAMPNFMATLALANGVT